MLILVDNNADTNLYWAGSDPGAPPPSLNYHMCLMGVGRIILMCLPIWGM